MYKNLPVVLAGLGGLQTMDCKGLISKFCFKLKNGNNEIVSFNGQSLTFRLSIEKKFY